MCEMEHTNQQYKVILPGMNKGKPWNLGKHKSSIIICNAGTVRWIMIFCFPLVGQVPYTPMKKVRSHLATAHIREGWSLKILHSQGTVTLQACA